MAGKILPGPCMACPYRKDVASGVWAPEEYVKLTLYDAPTCGQPFQPFACHATPDKYCHGWGGVPQQSRPRVRADFAAAVRSWREGAVTDRGAVR